MTQVIYYVAMSLDGFIANPDGGVDWLAPFEGTGEDYGYSEFYSSVDAVLMGSRTFEQILAFGEWPYRGKPCWVFSKRAFPQAPADVIITRRTPKQVLSELDARGVQRTWLVGGSALASSFRSGGLINEYIVSIIPIILGDGMPLFGSRGPTNELELVTSTRFENGVVQLRYLQRNAG